jgi:hypothetical protein
MLVQVERKSSLTDILSDASSRFASPIHLDKAVTERLGIYLLKFDFATVHEGKLLQQLRENRNVLNAQFDHLTTLRNTPDDPEFNQQWQWVNAGQTGGILDADTDADLAWDVTRGGVTALGDTIVVAIVDDGLDFNHEDISANVWYNYNEIDGNNIDDDANGYIDDIHGWNAYENIPDVYGESHGLQVAGMIGAVGNNGIGIAGLNWNVKIMMIVGGDPESAAIASYAYALEQRVLYEETHGARGAFVVATNSSWGIDLGQPADAPLWCAFYDSLGLHGILSAGATANNDDNIDVVGDLPTACPSEYLLSVTALNSSNQRTFSAYGLEHVDFGAPGEDIYTTKRNNRYGMSSGTSFASPTAAGLVALLYSSPCQTLAQLSHNNPALAAQYVRDLIFNGVVKDPVLENELRYGGSMNAGNSMQLLMKACSECPLPIGITADILSDTEVTLHWQATDSADIINARIQIVGSSTWDTIPDVSDPLELTGLVGCTEYLIEFEAICADTSTGFKDQFQFKTDGCCEIPAEISAVANTTTAHISWSFVLAANYYLIQWRPLGDTSWMEVVTSLQEVTLDHLEPCSFYEYRLQTNCDTSETGFSDIKTLRTRNCGNCIDLSYCDASSGNSAFEYIDSLTIGSLVNHSGQNGGYAFFESPGADFFAGQTYPVLIRPGFTGGPVNEQFRIWLDENQDGVFDEHELLFDSILADTEIFLLDSIVIPSTARAGSTRMRVSMAFYDPPFNIDQDPCGAIPFGEVEDYCVHILRENDSCPPVDTLIFDAIDFTSAFSYWRSVHGAIAYTYRWREEGTTEYKEFATIDTTAFIGDLKKCTTYEFQIRTVCLMDTSSYSNGNYTLKTDCDMVGTHEIPLLSSFNVFPNPTTDFVGIRLKAKVSGTYHIALVKYLWTR